MRPGRPSSLLTRHLLAGLISWAASLGVVLVAFLLQAGPGWELGLGGLAFLAAWIGLSDRLALPWPLRPRNDVVAVVGSLVTFGVAAVAWWFSFSLSIETIPLAWWATVFPILIFGTLVSALFKG